MCSLKAAFSHETCADMMTLIQQLGYRSEFDVGGSALKFRCAAQTWTCSRLTAQLRKEFDYGSWMITGVGHVLRDTLQRLSLSWSEPQKPATPPVKKRSRIASAAFDTRSGQLYDRVTAAGGSMIMT